MTTKIESENFFINFTVLTANYSWNSDVLRKKTFIDTSTFTNLIIQIHPLDRPLKFFEPSTFTLWIVQFHPLNHPLLSFGPSTFTFLTIRFHPLPRAFERSTSPANHSILKTVRFTPEPYTFRRTVHFLEDRPLSVKRPSTWTRDRPLSTDRPLSGPSTFPRLAKTYVP